MILGSEGVGELEGKIVYIDLDFPRPNYTRHVGVDNICYGLIKSLTDIFNCGYIFSKTRSKRRREL